MYTINLFVIYVTMENAQGIVLIEKGRFKLWYYHIMEIYHISWKNQIYVWKNVRKYTQMLAVGLWVIPPHPLFSFVLPSFYFFSSNLYNFYVQNYTINFR